MTDVGQGYPEQTPEEAEQEWSQYAYPRPINNWQQDQVLLRRYREALEKIMEMERWGDDYSIVHDVLPIVRAALEGEHD